MIASDNIMRSIKCAVIFSLKISINMVINLKTILFTKKFQLEYQEFTHKQFTSSLKFE